ncbi:MAG: 8-amino-7-oxononanoate synthase [Spartobacteria bacterium]|nr:8-amino-7-oxononanoate synthase [Spartobacteria bacterium]
MKNEDWIIPVLDEAKKNHLFRTAPVYAGGGSHLSTDDGALLNFSSNDYLNLSRHPNVIAAARRALETYGAGAGASRLVTGTLPLHESLEDAIATHKGYKAALVYGSGFMTNLGLIGALAGAADSLFADRLVHASLIDAARLSRARLHRFQHNDSGHLETLLKKPCSGRKIVITESVFSMDGDIAPLEEIARLAQAYGAMLLVDEAHATGLFGPCGSGRVRALQLEGQVNLSMGTLSKALGGYGGFTACSSRMRDYLINTSRSLIYSTAPPPAVVGAALSAMELLEDHPDWGRDVLAAAARFRVRLQAAGIDTGRSESQIVPVLVGDTSKALRLSAALRERGILAIAIRPPTVPRGTSRLRFSITRNHRPEELDHTADVLIHLLQGEHLP